MDADTGAEDDADDKVYNDVDTDDVDGDGASDCTEGDDAGYTKCINRAKEAKAAAAEAEAEAEATAAAAAAAAAATSGAGNSTVVAVVVVGVVLIILVVVGAVVLKTKLASSDDGNAYATGAFENPMYAPAGQSQPTPVSNPVYGDGGGGGHYMDVQTTGGGGGSGYMDVAPTDGNGSGSTAYVDVAASPQDGFGESFDSDDEDV